MISYINVRYCYQIWVSMTVKFILKDPNISKGIGGDVLAYVSMGGAKARRFLIKNDQKKVNAMWNCWKDLCQFTTNVASTPEVAKKEC